MRLVGLAAALTLSAVPALACAVAEGCPMGQLPPDPCATVRLEAGYVCVFDPSVPAGFRIEPAPDCGTADACARPTPAQTGQKVGGLLGVLLFPLTLLR